MTNGVKEHPATVTQSRAGTTLSGAGAGAATGAATGAAIGSFIPIPGVGTGAGALIGGLLGGIGGGYAGYMRGAPGTPDLSTSNQQRALAQMGGALDQSRLQVLGGYDDAIRARQAANVEAIRQMRMGLAAPAAGTLAGSGAAGLLGSGAAQAGSRQAALTAGLERDRMLQAGAAQEAQILQQKAAQQLGFAEQDVAALTQRLASIDTSIEEAKTAYPGRGEFLAWARAQRDTYNVGTPEWEKYNNAALLVEPNLMYSA